MSLIVLIALALVVVVILALVGTVIYLISRKKGE